MCVPGCQQAVMRRLTRRGFFKGAGVSAAAALAGSVIDAPAFAKPASFSRAKDLTHTISDLFPTFFGESGIDMEEVNVFDEDGFNAFIWHLSEHTGTHMDAPLHFSKVGISADVIPVDKLVVPLCIVNVAAKAQEDPDYQVSPDDIKAWEDKNGKVPPGSCVAMHSGWDKHVRGDKFRNVDADDVMHFPGFHHEAADMMMERKCAGMAVDTLSLDFGMSKTFDTHYSWLPSGRWGLECVANLGSLPASGATLVVGAPKIKGATGGPSRLIALY